MPEVTVFIVCCEAVAFTGPRTITEENNDQGRIKWNFPPDAEESNFVKRAFR